MPENKELNIEPSAESKIESLGNREEIRMVDLEKDREPIVRRKEVKDWIEKLEEDPIQQQNQTNNDDSGLQPIAPAVVKISLPTDRKSFTNGFTKPVDQAWRWLSEFVLRIIKRNKGKVKFKEE